MGRKGVVEGGEGERIVVLMTLSRGSSSFVTPVDIGGSLLSSPVVCPLTPRLLLVPANLILKPESKNGRLRRKKETSKLYAECKHRDYDTISVYGISRIGERYPRREPALQGRVIRGDSLLSRLETTVSRPWINAEICFIGSGASFAGS